MWAERRRAGFHSQPSSRESRNVTQSKGRRESPLFERTNVERKMKGGTLLVRTRQITPVAQLQIAAQFERPRAPKIKVHSAAGHDELKDAPTDSPEWEEYKQKVRDIDKQIERAQSDFLYDYAVESWSWDGGTTFFSDVPDDWKFPAVFERHGIHPSDNRRIDYIRYELITSNEDISVLFADALGNTAPITDQEVDAALGGFRTEVPGRRVARIGSKWGQRLQRALHGNDSSKSQRVESQ